MNQFLWNKKSGALPQKRLTYRQILWSIPFILLIHNVEEALTMPRWVSENLLLIRERMILFRYIEFSTDQIYISLLFVSIIPFIVALLCLRLPLQKKRVFIVLILQGIIFWNALIPHLSGIKLLGMYNPGAVTAVIFNIPFSVYLFRRSLKEGMFTAKNLRNIMLLALVAYLPVVYLNHLFAQFIASMFLQQ